MDNMQMENKKSLFTLPHNSRSIVHQFKSSNFKFKIKKRKHPVRQCLSRPEIQMFSKSIIFLKPMSKEGS